jgi:hypothetical protein
MYWGHQSLGTYQAPCLLNPQKGEISVPVPTAASVPQSRNTQNKNCLNSAPHCCPVSPIGRAGLSWDERREVLPSSQQIQPRTRI